MRKIIKITENQPVPDNAEYITSQIVKEYTRCSDTISYTKDVLYHYFLVGGETGK